jgi:hypothetical protein
MPSLKPRNPLNRAHIDLYFALRHAQANTHGTKFEQGGKRR